MNRDVAPTPTFLQVRWREGYSIPEVDDFVAEIRQLLTTTRLPDESLAQRIQLTRFTPVRFRRGYAMDDVDDHLDVLTALASQRVPGA